MGIDEVFEMLNESSGLLGISGSSEDVRDLLKESQEGRENSTLALAVFSYGARKYIGAYAAVLGGVEALVFTGGIGENSPEVRRSICEGLGFLGV